MKTSIAAVVSSALALPVAVDAVTLEASDHVNRAIIMEAQDGNTKGGEVQHVDVNFSETRFRFKGSEDMGNGWSTGVNLELGRHDNSRTRHANVSLSGPAGNMTFGAHADLGGASWLSGATNWCSYASMGSSVCPSNDGNRDSVLRYDTPAIGAAKLSALGSMDDGGYGMRVGYMDDTEIAIASAAFSVGQGTSIAVAWSQSDEGGAGYADEDQYVKLDHSYGDGSIGVYYKRAEEGGQEGSMWGLAVGHNLGAGATAYAGWRRSEGDQEDSMFEDENIDSLAHAPTVL